MEGGLAQDRSPQKSYPLKTNLRLISIHVNGFRMRNKVPVCSESLEGLEGRVTAGLGLCSGVWSEEGTGTPSDANGLVRFGSYSNKRKSYF